MWSWGAYWIWKLWGIEVFVKKSQEIRRKVRCCDAIQVSNYELSFRQEISALLTFLTCSLQVHKSHSICCAFTARFLWTLKSVSGTFFLHFLKKIAPKFCSRNSHSSFSCIFRIICVICVSAAPLAKFHRCMLGLSLLVVESGFCWDTLERVCGGLTRQNEHIRTGCTVLACKSFTYFFNLPCSIVLCENMSNLLCFSLSLIFCDI